ncbi:MAG: orotate phosphoribosyltransferase [Thaumarchaeota archaeon]|nr:orotate phosphoribosyltransferase [Nitrososphaerota archaeon]
MLSTEVAGTRQKLKEIMLKVGVVSHGKYVLASGQETDVYFSVKKAMLDAEGLAIIARIFYDKLKTLGVDAVGGLESGAIPIATAVSLLSQKEGVGIPAFYVRKVAKSHGDKARLEGPLKVNSKVAIVDDVTTKGGSVQMAIDVVKEMGCDIMKVLVLVDREEGASEKFKGYNYESIFLKSELIDPAHSV